MDDNGWKMGEVNLPTAGHVVRGRFGAGRRFAALAAARDAARGLDVLYPERAPHRVIEITSTERDVTDA